MASENSIVFFSYAFLYIEIKVYNVLGQKLFSSSLNKGQTTLKWRSDNIPNGLYIAKLFLDKKEMASTKIIVSK